MTTLLICFTVLLFLPLTIAMASVPWRLQQFGRVDIATPRAQADQMQGKGHRVVAAQHNAWEALILFIGAMVFVSLTNTSPASVALPAIIFVLLRIIHAVSYIQDIALLRVMSFFSGIGVLIWILTMAF